MAAQVAARVAERYAKAPSYSEVLAARAVAAAEAAQNAASAAQQAHEAAQWLLSSVADGPAVMELIDSADAGLGSVSVSESGGPENFDERGLAPRRYAAPIVAVEDETEWRLTPTSVSHPDPLPVRSTVPDRRWNEGSPAPEPRFPDPRYYPTPDLVEEATVAPAQPLLSKLIEFPRELVAPRKSRPRLAEGPLIEDEADQSRHLRIFEVDGPAEAEGWVAEAARMQNGQVKPEETTEAPEWHSIRLGEHPESPQNPALDRAGSEHAHHSLTQAAAAVSLHTASIEDRAMAALVDLSLVGLGFLLFVLLFAVSASHLPAPGTSLIAAGALVACVYLLYQWLFMSYGAGTPGMRYAQIALCSFRDDNPTRKAMKRRVWATLVAALPVGLGLLWAIFDEDGLGWHDRMTRTYQRSYR